MKLFYSHNSFQLYHGDCLDMAEIIPENSIDMIFADPPYFLSGGTYTCHGGKAVSVKKAEWDMGDSMEERFAFHKQWIAECKRVLKPNGTIWISGTYHSIYQCGYALQINDFKILNDIVWFKPNAAPNLSTRCFTASHETLIWAKKDKDSKHYFNYDLMKNEDWGKDILKNQNKQMRSVWSIGTVPKSEKEFGRHPTQKPMELLKRIILASTKENDTILDPFTGSSTTGIAASMHNRKFIGIDKELEYLDLSFLRYSCLPTLSK